MKLQHLDHITITAKDPARSVAFYRDVLGMTMAFEWPGEVSVLRAGETYLAIAWWNSGKAPERPPAIAVHHFAFKVDADSYHEAKTALPRQGVEIEEESDHGVHQSLYFRDPDGHLLELACYELPGAPANMPRIYEPS